MKILSWHFGHDGSLTYSNNNKLIFHTQLDRFNGYKHNAIISKSLINKLSNLNVDLFIVTYVVNNSWVDRAIDYLKHRKVINSDTKIKIIGRNHHHIFHAFCVKYLSKFKEGGIWVSDGSGAFVKDRYLEAVSGYTFYNNSLKEKYKYYYDSKIPNKVPVQVGMMYSKLVCNFKMKPHFDENKIMAFSEYGKETKNIQTFIDKDNNFKFLDPNYNGNLPIPNVRELYTDDLDEFAKDVAYRVQKDFEYKYYTDVREFVQKNNIKNLCLSGGCSMNILNNTYLKKELNVNIFIDPLCNDQGISLGANVLANIENTNKDLEPVDDVFLGLEVEYDLNIFKGYDIVDYNDSKVAKLLNDGHVIGLFQGRSEQGQRGLGNRSLLAHPNYEGILDKVNKIKKREWYRPFACSVLDDQKEKYFNCDFKSPYMLYVFEGKHKLKNIASITNKSRIQTVDKGMRFYDIINEFFKLSKIPYVLNTSLNIPGDPLVENMADLKYMLDNTDLKYVYLPDINKLITK
tara:strand:- start:267 stop:1811 length:1545 start_codon:yes stop_codon:yes gene_type:complete